ncbi:MAG: oxidoreductase [Alphaproteobacteria bacterium]|nr:oxidoreductase [Alphaproteobacteria bacterium]
MNTEKDIGVGLVGYGFAGKTFHAPLIQAVDGLALRAIASGDVAKVRKDFPGMRVHADPAELMLADGVDLVVIATPNASHASLARAALTAGRHVVIDKPFALDMGEARALVALAEKQGCLLSVFHNRRWDSDFLAAKFGVESGVLGRVTHFESRIDRFQPDVRDCWRERDEPGAGIWYDLAPHMIDQALVLFGLPDSVRADFQMQRTDAKAVDWAHAVLDYPHHRVLLHASLIAAGGAPRFLVQGDKGSLVKTGSDPQEAQLLSGMRPGAQGWGVDLDRMQIWNAARECRGMPTPAGDHRRYYNSVRDALRGLAPLAVPPIQALAVMAVLEAALLSAEKGTRESVQLTEAERRAFVASRAK